MANDVEVSFGANVEGIDKGAAQVRQRLEALSDHVSTLQEAFKGLGDGMKEGFDGLTDSLSKVNDGFKALNDAIAKGGATLNTGWMKLLFGGAIGGAAAGVLTVFHNIQEEFLKMDRAAHEAGLSLERYQEVQYAMSQSGAGPDKWEKGLEEASKKLSELTHDSGELGKFLDKNNIKWKDSAGHIIDINRYIEESIRLISNAANQGDRFKAAEILGWGKEMARAFQGGTAEMARLAQEAHKTGAVLSDEMIEKAVQFEKEWNAASLRWATYFKQIIVSLTPFMQGLISGFGEMVDRFRDHWYETVNDAISKQTVTAGNAVSMAFAGMSAARQPLDDIVTRTKAWAAGLGGVSDDWKSIVNNAKATSDSLAHMATYTYPSKNATQFADKDKDKKKGDPELTAMNEDLDKWREYYAKLVVYEKNAVDTNKQTETQKVSNLLAALADRETNEKAIYDKEIAHEKDNAAKIATIRRQMNKEMELIEKERMQLEAENLKRSVQEWTSVTDTIMGAWNSQLRGLLARTTSWAQAMRSIASSLVIKIIEEFEKLAIVKPLSSMMANMFSAPTEMFAGLMKMIQSLFGPLLAGFTSFFAPTLGPYAPAAGAAAAGTTVAAAAATVGAYEFGTDYVPRTGLALVHQGEAITPAGLNPAAGGAAGGVSPVFQVQALDATGVQGFFTRYGPQIAKVLTAHMDNNPATFRS